MLLFGWPGLCSYQCAKGHPVLGLQRAVFLFFSSIREVAQCHRDVEQELAHAVNASSKAMDRVYGKPRASEVLIFPGLTP